MKKLEWKDDKYGSGSTATPLKGLIRCSVSWRSPKEAEHSDDPRHGYLWTITAGSRKWKDKGGCGGSKEAQEECEKALAIVLKQIRNEIDEIFKD